MTAQLIDGKAIAAKLRKSLAQEIAQHVEKGKRPPGLAVILVGEDPASQVYVRNKRQACTEVGIESFYYPLPSEVSNQELFHLITELNHDPKVDGILLQLPLPAHIDQDALIEHINPKKDVDGFHPYNLGRLAQRRPLLRPCTPYGVMTLLDEIKIDCKGKNAVIVGASNIVGRPMAFELLIAGATITLCHRLTQNLETLVSTADILISAVGKPHLIKGSWIKPGAVVIDIGINRLADGTLTGDIDFNTAREKASYITPVPGGVGPMTIYSLLKNTVSIWTGHA